MRSVQSRFGCILAMALCVASFTAHAEPSGYSGRASATSAGCGTCHGGSASSATTVSLLGGAPTSVLPGSTTQFTIVVAHATQRVAGVDIAVRTTATGSTAAGTLAVIAGQGTRLRQGEVTQSTPKTMSNGQATFTFNWTAPTTEGTYYLQAVGNACNGNGSDDSGDRWAFMQAVPIVVSSVNSINEDIDAPALVVSPNPLYGGAPLLINGLPATANRLSIMASNGAMVYSVDIDPSASEQPFNLPNLPSGTYAVLVSTRTGVVSAPLVVLK